MRPKLEVI